MDKELRKADEIWGRASKAGRELTDAEVEEIERLMEIREKKIEAGMPGNKGCRIL